MSDLLLLTSALEPAPEILPSLGLLLHSVRIGPPEVPVLADAPPADAILVDARRDLAQARSLCLLLRTASLDAPLLAVVTEGGLAAVTADWGADDVILHTAGPAEVEARLRLAIGRRASLAPAAPDEIRSGDLAIDEATYTARLRTRALDLTFKEFELLKFLAQHPGRVFTRAHLLQEVWGYDYFGGTRTVDVHVRRLRAKLGTEHEALIGTVRNVGYRFVPAKGADEGRAPRASGPADQDPANGGVTEADGLPADGGGRPGPAAGRQRPGRQRPGRAETRPAETRRPVPHPPTGAEGPPPAGDEAPLITATGPLAQAEAARVLQLAGAAAGHDAVGPLSEPVLLELRYGGDPQARNLLLTAGPALAGYAHLGPPPGRDPAATRPRPRPTRTRARPRNW